MRNKKKKKQEVTVQEAYEIVKHSVRKNTKKVSDLPYPARVAISQGLQNADYSIRKIAQITGLDKDTINRYVNLQIEDKYVQFRDAMSNIHAEQREHLKFIASSALKTKLQDEDSNKLADVTQAFKVLHDVPGEQRAHNNQSAQILTVNIHPSLNRSKRK